jgi:hypothetical protein
MFIVRVNLLGQVLVHEMKRSLYITRSLIKRPDVRWSLGALFVYTLGTLALLYPVPFRLSSVIAGSESGDAYQYTWSLWWAKQAMLDRDKSLAHLTLMNHPIGVEHPFMLTMVSVDLVALPFSLLFSPSTAYNLQILLSFILSGMTMYWLCTELSNDRRAGLVGGFIFAFFLNKTGHAMAGHLPQVTAYWLPLYVLLLWRVTHRPRWSIALVAASVLALACLIHVMHLVYFIVPVTATVLLSTLANMKRAFFTWQRLGSLALTFGLAALVVLPLLLPIVSLSGGDADTFYKPGTVEHSTDLLAFFTPSPYHPILSSLGWIPPSAKRIFYDQETLYEGLAYPGVLALGLALWGLVRQRRRMWTWGVLGLATAVLSLGPLLKINNDLVHYQVDAYRSYLVLPYALLKQVPLLRAGRTSGRLNETTMFVVAILASYGAAGLFSLVAKRPRLSAALLTALLIGIGLEYVAIWPFPTSTAEVPPAIRSIADEPGDGALLHIAMKRRWVNHRALYYQTVTPRPVVGGEVHRAVPEAIPWSETLAGLIQPDQAAGDVIPRPDSSERVDWLHYFSVDYVIFHKIKDRDDASYREFIEGMLGPAKYEDGTLAAFPTSLCKGKRSGSFLYTLSHDGWYPPEQDGGLWRRWTSDEGKLYLCSLREETGSLHFAVDSHLEFPVLDVYLGDHLLDSLVVGGRTVYSTRPFTITRGMNVFRFQAPGGCLDVLDDPQCWSTVSLDSSTGNADNKHPRAISCDPAHVPVTRRAFIFDSVSFIPQDELSPGEALDVNFGHKMRLRGWDLSAKTFHPGDVMTVTLAWEATAKLNDQHVVFVHLVSPGGVLMAQHDAPPVAQLPPAPTISVNSVQVNDVHPEAEAAPSHIKGSEATPSAWPRGTTFGYPVTIELPTDLPADEYQVLLGVYLWPSLERLPVLADVPGAENNTMVLGSVRVHGEEDSN